ncbi:cation efflux family protein [Brugia malayi]|uniref:Bm5186, isoform a n=2 Tax=Brugia malayi TaxID=6279 RepID=A0A1P6C3N9_BRUMA|nr:cation efflux family protein [Brugia malayi]CRZ25341.1 Bm5186, isoform a [Brugia malayi]VIO91272.1 cation efflux family protein [Brugia malayi]
MAGGGSSKELRVPKVNGTTTLDGLRDVNRPMNFKLPHFNDNEEAETSEDDEIAFCPSTGHITTEQLLDRKTTLPHNSYSASSIGIMFSHPSLLLNRNPKRVSKFYRKQSDLVENFKKDSTAIEEHRRQRQKGHSSEQSIENYMESKMMLLEGNSNSEKAFLKSASTKGKHKTPAVRVKKKRIKPSRNKSADKAARWLAMTTLIVNVSLAVAKTAAAYLSGSLSIISSLVDSAVDITSGLVIWLTARAIRKRDPYMYPRGRTRLEPIALIIVSVIMGVASVQMVVQSLESVVNDTVDPRVDVVSLFIMVAIIFIKFALMLLCKKFDYNSSVAVLAQDHWNDCISNTVAILCAWVASNYWMYFDPIGAIVVSIYIAITWFFTGKEHLAMLSGKSAKPEFINRIVKVCVEHDKRIDYIDTVYVYHFGTRFLVEVHIVMNPDMTLRESHDISEALQTSIESLAEVERAFVHCDYEYDHLPADEHKVV